MTARRLPTVPLLAAVAALAVVAGACGGGKSSPTAVTTAPDAAGVATSGAVAGATVTVKNTAFTPATVSVKTGDKLTWRFEDTVAHHVKADDGSFDSGDKQSGTYEHAFTKAGSFTYICTIHPFMKGTVTVA